MGPCRGAQFRRSGGTDAVMHRILVEEQRWIGETRFLHALNYCMLLPGPEAHQLAVISVGCFTGPAGYRRRHSIRAPGFDLPRGAKLDLCRLRQYRHRASTVFWSEGGGASGRPRSGRAGWPACAESRAMVAFAALAFIGIFFFAVPFPIIIAAAAAIGFAGNAAGLEWFRALGAMGRRRWRGPAAIDEAFARDIPEHVRPHPRLVKVAVIGLTRLARPAFRSARGGRPRQRLHDDRCLQCQDGGGDIRRCLCGARLYGSASCRELPLAEAGRDAGRSRLCRDDAWTAHQRRPVSLVSWRHFAIRERLDPVLAGTLGGILRCGTTFVPSFLWIFLGAPYIEALQGNKALTAALSAITAASSGSSSISRSGSRSTRCSAKSMSSTHTEWFFKFRL